MEQEMPSPSKLSLVFGVVATASLMVAGAWLASQAHAEDGSLPGSENVAPQPNDIAAAAPVSGPLVVTVEGVRNESGKIIIVVFQDEVSYSTYDYEAAAGYAEIAATTEPLIHTFSELNDGPYAVVLFHDENNDNQLNMSGQYPVEGYGTSGANGPYDEPNFEQASFPAGDVVIEAYYLE
jgi:uncharacterized protein (DUF2141 family)